jgi:hypothetical protein
MRTKLFIGSASVIVLVFTAVAFDGTFNRAQPTVVPEPVKAAEQCAEPCCTDGCCPECLACCAEDGCCPECILCCIAMGCDPACCFPSSTSAKAEASSTKPAAKSATACRADGCCK